MSLLRGYIAGEDDLAHQAESPSCMCSELQLISPLPLYIFVHQLHCF